MAACGAKVLMLRCVEYARRYNVPIHVRSSYTDRPGTIVTGSIEDIQMEDAILTGVAHDRSEAKVTVVGLPDVPGYAAKVFRAVAEADVNIDMVLQNISKIEDGKTDITFVLAGFGPDGRREAEHSQGRDRVRRSPLRRSHRQGVVGRRRMRSHPGAHRDVLRGAGRGGCQHRAHLDVRTESRCWSRTLSWTRPCRRCTRPSAGRRRRGCRLRRTGR